MYAFVEDATGELVAYGDDADGIHDDAVVSIDIGEDDRLATGYGEWDPATRTVKDVDVTPAEVEAALATLSDPVALEARLKKLQTYKTDPDLLAVLANPNNTALPTATLNRALKTIIRREERMTAAIAALARLVGGSEMLGDISDTTDVP